jgi:hypothetical protein
MRTHGYARRFHNKKKTGKDEEEDPPEVEDATSTTLRKALVPAIAVTNHWELG